MEIGEESVHNLVAVAGVEERMRHARLRFHDSVRIGNCFDNAGTRRPDRHDAATFALGLVDDFGMYFKNGDVDDLAKRLEEATYMDWQLKSNEAIMISQRFNANVIAEQWKTLIEKE